MKQQTKFISAISLALTTLCSLIGSGALQSKSPKTSFGQLTPVLRGNTLLKANDPLKEYENKIQLLLDSSNKTAKILSQARDTSSPGPSSVNIGSDNNLSIKFSPYFLLNRVDDLLNGTNASATWRKDAWKKLIAYSDVYQNLVNDRLQDEIKNNNDYQPNSVNKTIKASNHDLVINTTVFGVPISVIGVTSSGEKATHIDVPDGIMRISTKAFSGCSNLRTISLPKSIRIIDEKAFENCTSLQEFTIPRTISKLSDEMFSGCTSLTTMTLPTGVLSIGENTFRNCKNLSTLIINGDLQEVKSTSFSGCTNLKHVYVFSKDVEDLLKNTGKLKDNQIVNLNKFDAELKTTKTLYFTSDKNIHVDLNTINFSAIPGQDLFGLNFRGQTFNFPYYHGFLNGGVLQLVIQNPAQYKVKSDSMFARSPSVRFAFTTTFSDLIQNLNQLPAQLQFLIEAKKNIIKGDANKNLDSIIDSIKNFKASYDQVNQVISDIKKSHTVKKPDDYKIGRSVAAWYTNATSKWKFSLDGVGIGNWHYFVELASLRFSEDLFSSVTYGGGVKTEDVTVWDSISYEFKSITNDGKQDYDLASKNKAEVKVNNPFNEFADNSSITPDVTDAKNMVSKLGWQYKLKNDKDSIDYTYLYNQNPFGYSISDFAISATGTQNKYTVAFKLGCTNTQDGIGNPPKDVQKVLFSLVEEKTKSNQTTFNLTFDLSEPKSNDGHDWIREELFKSNQTAAGFELIQKEFKTKILDWLNGQVQKRKHWENCCFNDIDDELLSTNKKSGVFVPKLTCEFSNHKTIDLAGLPIMFVVPTFVDSEQKPDVFKKDLFDQINQNINSYFKRDGKDPSGFMLAESDYIITGLDGLHSDSLQGQISIAPAIDSKNFALHGQKTISVTIEQRSIVQQGQLRYSSTSADETLADFVKYQNSQKSKDELAQTWLTGFDVTTIQKVQLVQVDNKHFSVQVTLKQRYVFGKGSDANHWTSTPVEFLSTLPPAKRHHHHEWKLPLVIGLGVGVPLALLVGVGMWFGFSYWKTKKQIDQE